MMRIIPVFVLLVISAPFAMSAFPDMRDRDESRQKELEPRLGKIRKEHPRIFCRSDEIPEIRARVESDPEVAEVYGWLMDWARSDQYYRNLWATGNQLIAACVAYRLSPERKILDHAVRIADYLSEAEGDSWTWPRIAKGLAFAFDWLSDDLTAEQKTKYGKAAIEAGKRCYDTWRHSDFNNHQYLEYGPILYVGIALRDEGIDDAAAHRMALDGLNLLVDHFMPAHELACRGDGGWAESMSYHDFFTYEFAYLIELWASASGEPIWDDFTGLDGEANWLIHCNRPFDGGHVAIADIGKRDSFSEANAQYLTLLSRRRRDGLAKYLANSIKEEAKRRHASGARYVRNGSSWWGYVLWYDPSLEVVIREELPTSALFRGIGWAAMRSDWSRDATFAMFVCAPLWLGGHQHADNNSFIIHKGGLLALDSGVYEGTSHRANYYARTIAHNSVLVFDPQEMFPGGTWGTGRLGEGSNDGGQLLGAGPNRVAELVGNESFIRGQILAYDSNGQITCVVGDATKSYSPHKMKEFIRTFLYIRPDLFIVFDRVESSRAEYPKTWLLHSAAEPEINGNEVIIENDLCRLRSFTLLPDPPEISRIGGPGREFEVNGTNYPPRNSYDPEEAGRWRIEVRPKERIKRQYFLHVLSVEEKSKPHAVTASSESTGKQIIARIDFDEARIEATFGATEAPFCKVVIEKEGQTTVHTMGRPRL